MTQENNHQQVRELLGAYALGGVDEEQKKLVERHLGECGECQMELNGLLAMNQELTGLFEGVGASGDIEDRASGAFLERASRVSILSITYWKGKIMNKPVIRKAAACVAAAILLGSVGKVAGSFIESGRLPMAAKVQTRAITEEERMASEMGKTPRDEKSEMGLLHSSEPGAVNGRTVNKWSRDNWENSTNREGETEDLFYLRKAGDGLEADKKTIQDEKYSYQEKVARGIQAQQDSRIYEWSDREVDGRKLAQKSQDALGLRRDVNGLLSELDLADGGNDLEKKKIGKWYFNDQLAAPATGVDARSGLAKSKEEAVGVVVEHLKNAPADGIVMNRPTVVEGLDMDGLVENQMRSQQLKYNSTMGKAAAASGPVAMGEIGGMGGGMGGYVGGDAVVGGYGAFGGGTSLEKQKTSVQDGMNIQLGGNQGGMDVFGGSSLAHFGEPATDMPVNVLQSSLPNDKTMMRGSVVLGVEGTKGVERKADLSDDLKKGSTAYFKLVDEAQNVTTTIAAAAEAGSNRSTITSGRDLSMAETPATGKPLSTSDTSKTPSNVAMATEAFAPPNAPVSTAVQQAMSQRKVIRNGNMEFEVESFDSGYVTVTQIVKEEGGYISGTNSEKLDNGKVRGTITVRVTPDRLDTLVLKLRGLGTLKSQKINAQDVTKDYYDMDSELRALRAMETRLIDLIKTGKGEVKDLVEAEKQLANYRVQIEKLEGSIRYYDSQVSLSTLVLTLMEKDIKAPAAVTSTEVVQMGCESEDVEKAAKQAVETIEKTFKGKIIESTLKKYDAGQYAANIVAEVDPDSVNALLDQIKLIGKVGRLDRELKQTSPGVDGTPIPTTKVERKNTKLNLSIYNLANIAPRKTTNANIAVADVAGAYNEIVSMVSEKFGGRVVTSNLNRQKPEQTTATMTFEVPAEKANDALEALKSGRDMMSMTVTENPDTQNVTSAKQGFSLRMYSTATVAARETQTITLATTRPVSEVFPTLEEKLGGIKSARVVSSQLNVQNKANIFGSMDFEAPRLGRQDVEQALKDCGIYFNRTVSRSTDTENTIDSKMRFQVRVISMDTIPSRETRTLTIVTTKPVREAFNQLEEKIGKIEGRRVIASALNEQNPAVLSGSMDVEISKEALNAVDQAVDDAGSVFNRSVNRSTDSDNTTDSKVRYQLRVISLDSIPARETRAQTVATGKPVREAFGVLEEKLAKIDGKRVISSQLNEQNPANIFGTMEIEVQRDSALEASKTAMAKLDQAISEAGLMFDRATTRSTNTDGTIDTKIRYSLRLVSQEVIPARESRTITAGVNDVNDAMAKLTSGVRKLGGRVMQSPITEGTGSRYSGLLEFEVPTEKLDDAIKLIESYSAPYKRSTQESNDLKNTLDAKRRFVVGLVDMKNVPPSQRQSILVSADNADKATKEIREKIEKLGGRVLDMNRQAKSGSQVTCFLAADMPLDKAKELDAEIQEAWKVTGGSMNQDDSMPRTGPAARAMFELKISNAQGIIDDETGIWSSFRKAMGTSVRGLLWSLQMIIVGVLLIGPWAAIGWGAMKWRKRNKTVKAQ